MGLVPSSLSFLYSLLLREGISRSAAVETIRGELAIGRVSTRRNLVCGGQATMVRCLVLAAPHGIFNVQRHLTSARTHCDFRVSAPQTWCQVVIAARARRASRFFTCRILQRDSAIESADLAALQRDYALVLKICGRGRSLESAGHRAFPPRIHARATPHPCLPIAGNQRRRE